MPIQWFPGHMAKTEREIYEVIRHIDLIVEVVDARAPLASRNPLFEELITQKPAIILFNKSDLADRAASEEWKRFFKREKGVTVLSVNGKKRGTLKAITETVTPLFHDKKWASRRAVRALIGGIPNVGKSTIINTLSARTRAKVENRPGVTKSVSRWRVSPKLELFDTPGLLWHKFEDQSVGYKLALIGGIREEVLDREDIAVKCISYLKEFYPDRVKERYNLESLEREAWEIMRDIALSRRFLLPKGEPDLQRASSHLLKEVRDGGLGPLSFEMVEKEFDWLT